MTESKIYLFNFITFDNIDIIETTKNQNGLVAISTHPEHNVVAFPGEEKGVVKVKIYHEDDEESAANDNIDVISSKYFFIDLF